jgi:hypothetical protein
MKKKNDAQEECGCWCEFPAMGHDRESRGRHLVLCLGPRNWLPQIHPDGRSAQLRSMLGPLGWEVNLEKSLELVISWTPSISRQ